MRGAGLQVPPLAGTRHAAACSLTGAVPRLSPAATLAGVPTDRRKSPLPVPNPAAAGVRAAQGDGTLVNPGTGTTAVPLQDRLLSGLEAPCGEHRAYRPPDPQGHSNPLRLQLIMCWAVQGLPLLCRCVSSHAEGSTADTAHDLHVPSPSWKLSPAPSQAWSPARQPPQVASVWPPR